MVVRSFVLRPSFKLARSGKGAPKIMLERRHIISSQYSFQTRKRLIHTVQLHYAKSDIHLPLL